MWSLVGLGVALVVVFVLAEKRFPIGLALILGALITGMTAGYTPAGLVKACWSGLSGQDSVTLLESLALIGVLSFCLNQLGIFQRMTGALEQALGSTRLTIAAIPSILGLLPVLGGAVMAAPMVDRLGDRLGITPERKCAINLVFRHWTAPVYPFFPTFILVTQLAGVSPLTLSLYDLPLAVGWLIISYLLLVRPLCEPDGEASPARLRAWGATCYYASPIWLSLVLALVFHWAFSLALLAATAAALLIGYQGIHRLDVKGLITNGLNWPVLLAGAGSMMFKTVIMNAPALARVLASVGGIGIPPVLLFMVVPFAAGLVCASGTASISLSFPILMTIMGGTHIPIRLAAAALFSAQTGYLISPLHLCQVLSLDYFHAQPVKLYREYALSVAGLVLGLVVQVVLTGMI